MASRLKNIYKLLAAVTITMMVAGSTVPSVSAAVFSDVSTKYQNAVEYVVSKGLNGLSSTAFGTSENIKRVDAAIMIAEVLDLDIEEAPASGFTDVPTRAVKYVNALKAADITNGKTATTLDSQSEITRGELAIWIQRGFKLTGNGVPLSFTDVGDRYTSAVSALVSNEITSGTTPITFGTSDFAKRGDYAIFLYRANQAISGSTDLEVIEIQ